MKPSSGHEPIQRLAVGRRATASNTVVLLVPKAGAVWVHPGWRQFEQLDPGDHGTGAKWWTSADAVFPLDTYQAEPSLNRQ